MAVLSIAGLHVTSRRPCWRCVRIKRKAFLSLGTKPNFHVNSSRKNSIVLTTNTPPIWPPCHVIVSQECQVLLQTKSPCLKRMPRGSPCLYINSLVNFFESLFVNLETIVNWLDLKFVKTSEVGLGKKKKKMVNSWPAGYEQLVDAFRLHFPYRL